MNVYPELKAPLEQHWNALWSASNATEKVLSSQREHLSGTQDTAGVVLERALVGLHCNQEL